MNPIAIIPARGGSKRLPGKNMMRIGDLTLVDIALDAALDSGLVSWDAGAFDGELVFVTTDSVDVADHLRRHEGVTLINRPSPLAQDETPMVPVVTHALEFARGLGVRPDSVVLLQPTSPLRTAEDIRCALGLMEASGADAVISVCETRYPEVFTLGHAGRLRPVDIDTRHNKLVVPNGAIFAITTKALDAGLDWWTAPLVYAYEMPASRSIDIDTQADLDQARRMME